jgi:ribonuclease BN (tRNA processing enzyme)
MKPTIAVTVLGSGTLIPDGRRSSSGYFIEAGDARVMLDCGAGTVHALARYNLEWERISHIFVSHFHVDHVGELASLLFAFRYGMKSERCEPLTLMGPRGLEMIVNGLETAYGNKLFQLPFPLEIKLLDPEDRIALGSDSSLGVASTPHTKESLAVRIQAGVRSVCYTGDTDYDEALAALFSRTDLLISECSFEDPKPGVRHLSVDGASKLAALSEAARLVLSHFYFEVNEPELKARVQRNYQGETLVAFDGMRVEF